MHLRNEKAFSMVELLTVMSIIFILASLLVVALASGHAKSQQTACLSNLRQIGLAFTGFTMDHEGKYPVDIPYRLGGSQEFTRSNLVENTPFSRAYQHFIVLSNEAPNVKIMTCPADRKHRRAENYASFTATNLSYWLNPLASPHATLDVLAGDWNMHATASTTNNVKLLDFGREVHPRRGTLLFADGRVEITRKIAFADRPPAEAQTASLDNGPGRPVPSGPGAMAPPTPPDSPPSRFHPNYPPVSSTPSGSAPESTPSAKEGAGQKSMGTNSVPRSYAWTKRESDRRPLIAASTANGSPPKPEGPITSQRSRLSRELNEEGAGSEEEQWNTPGFRLFKLLAMGSYLFSLLLALAALLVIYLRSRLANKDDQENA